MTLIPDASSVYQESLPVSSDDLLKLLDQWGIIYNRTNHAPLKTVEDSKKIQYQFLSSKEGGGHIKNLYLRDNKKRSFLLVTEQDRKIDLKFGRSESKRRQIVCYWKCCRQYEIESKKSDQSSRMRFFTDTDSVYRALANSFIRSGLA